MKVSQGGDEDSSRESWVKDNMSGGCMMGDIA